jgi:segregation and condensation protein A
MVGFSVRTEVFDGPLDLLLYLVQKDGIDLRKIAIARIADAYLAYLDRMRDLNLGIAAEYLVMAATLCYLKSLELLPRAPTATGAAEDEEDPRQKLIQQLIEHQRYREAADHLDARPQLGRDVFAREPVAIDADSARTVVAGVDAFRLLDVFHDLLRKASAPEPVHTLAARGPDIGSCCRAVLAALGGPGGTGVLQDVLGRMPTRIERIVAFLAVLEMARLGWLGLRQDEHTGPVELTSRVEADVDLTPIIGRVAVVEPAAAEAS